MTPILVDQIAVVPPEVIRRQPGPLHVRLQVQVVEVGIPPDLRHDLWTRTGHQQVREDARVTNSGAAAGTRDDQDVHRDVRVDLVVLLGHVLVRGRTDARAPVGRELQPHRWAHRLGLHHYFLDDGLLDDLLDLDDLGHDLLDLDRNLDFLGDDLFLRDDAINRDFLDLGPCHDRLDGNFLDDGGLDRDFLGDDRWLRLAAGGQRRDARRADTQSAGDAQHPTSGHVRTDSHTVSLP